MHQVMHISMYSLSYTLIHTCFVHISALFNWCWFLCRCITLEEFQCCKCYFLLQYGERRVLYKPTVIWMFCCPTTACVLVKIIARIHACVHCQPQVRSGTNTLLTFTYPAFRIRFVSCYNIYSFITALEYIVALAHGNYVFI